MKKKITKIGLALGGGGGKGAYHIGIFKSLKENNLMDKISAISGTSVGSLNAILFVQGDLEVATYIWRSEIEKEILYFDHNSFKNNWDFFKNFIFFDLQNKNIGDFIEEYKIKSAIFSRKGLSNIINSYIHPDYTSKPTINTYVTCTREYLHTAEYFNIATFKSRDEIIRVLLASSAIPAIFGHEKIGNQLYYDGGVTDNLPIKPLYDEGCDLIITAPLWRDNRVKEKYFPHCHFIELVPENDLGGVAGLFDFSPRNSRILMKQAYDAHHDLISTISSVFEIN